MSDYSPILSEHMAAPKEESSNEHDYHPTDLEKKDLKYVEKLFAKAKKAKSPYDVKWLDWYKMFRGKQWKEQRPTYRHSEVLNLIFQTIQSQVPIITDTRPKFEFLPQEPQDYDLAEVLNMIADADWQKHNWMYELTEVIYDGHIYGTGVSTLQFDPKENYICFESSDPFYAFPDPNARDVNKKSSYFIYAEPMPLDQIKEKWPEKGRYVKADLIDLMHGNKTDLGPIRYKSPTDSRTFVQGEAIGAYDVNDAKDKALVITLYCKSDECEEDLTDPLDTSDPIISEVASSMNAVDMPEDQGSGEMPLKYPNGKKIVIANGVVLETGHNPYEHKLFPFQRWQNYVLPREFWGMSEIEQLEGPQKTFNKIISFVLDVMTLMGNPVWVVDSTAGIDTENLINRPGAIIEKEPGSQVQRVEGTQLQPYVLQVIDRYKEWFDQISGANDVTRGINPGGVTAASAIESLQNAAQTRIRQKSRNLDVYLEQLGEQYVSLVFQFYTAPQVFRLTNKDGSQKYFKFHVDPETQSAFVENFNDQGQSLGIDQYQMQGKFDVKVTTGTSLPFAKDAKATQLLNLFDRQIIDSEEVLKGLDYPNADAVLTRMQQKQQQMAAAQQQGQPAQQNQAG